MKATYTFEGTLSGNISIDLLKKLPESKTILQLERKYGFVEIHKDNEIEYTTADILEKGL